LVKLSGTNNVAVATKKDFASINEVVKASIGKNVEATLSSGARLWGRLEWVDDIWIVIRGYRGQAITIRKSKMAALVEVI
jgi:hypothetical protein